MPYLDDSSKPVHALMRNLGNRLEKLRLSQNQRQEDVAREAGISRITVGKLEGGEGGSLETFLRVMRALGLGDRLLDLIPDASISPMQVRADRITQRQRARRPNPDKAGAPWTWGDK